MKKLSVFDRIRSRMPVTKKDLAKVERKIMALQDELDAATARIDAMAQANADTTQKLVKIQAEVQALIDAKPDPTTLPANFLAALERLEQTQAAETAQAQVVDDQNPDAPAPEPTTEPG